MQEFIQMATSQLGIGEDTATTATGAVLKMVKAKLGDGDFGQLSAAVPGLAEMATGGSGGGGLGGLMGKAAGMLGGQAGGAAGLLGLVTSSGLSLDQAGSFVPLLFNFIKGKAGTDLFNTLVQKIPEIKGMLG